MTWHKISDGLPSKQDKYLVRCREKYLGYGPETITANLFFTESGHKWEPDNDFISGRDYDLDTIVVTHWMPLPPAPEGR